MKILFALPGLHRVQRGAEIAFISIAKQLVNLGEAVTLAGSGPEDASAIYDYVQVPAVPREKFERWPHLPLLRGETAYEDASFAWGLGRKVDISDFDITVTCSYPFTNFALRAGREGGNGKHVFVTQNGDWPAYSDKAEYRFFNCDGLVCINPQYFERNKDRFESALIPNGVDLDRFIPGNGDRKRFGLPSGVPMALMVSAMIESKKVEEGIRAVASLDGVHLAVAGDGPERKQLHALADALMPGRFHQIAASPADMPTLYRSADCFVHLSRDESFGNVYVEAMSCGIATIVCDLPHTRWILGDTAQYVTVGDVTELATTVRNSIDHSANAVTAKKQVLRARQFSWDEIANQYAEFFRHLVSSDGAPASGQNGLAR